MFKFLKKTKRISDVEEASKMFEVQKESITRLMKNKDFQEILLYWKREYDIIDSRIDNLKGTELENAVETRKLIKKFLNWLENLSREEEKDEEEQNKN